MAKRPTFEQATARYVHRFTMDHVPAWSQRAPEERGAMLVRGYCAPQFRSDREWYEHTLFKGDDGYIGIGNDCYTSGQTWPLGNWLLAPFKR